MKKIFSIFAALTLSAGLWAFDNVPYIDANGQPQTANDVTEITNATSQDWWSEGWYVVKGSDVTLSKGAECSGAVNLILADGAKLTVTGEDGPGIDVSDQYSSLTIYGQANQSGQLIANGDMDAAGIGGGNSRRGYNITINGGTVIANGGSDGAGIGGGRSNEGKNITINGGKVIATGGGGGAGIGGGIFAFGEKITINGGIVTAIGGENAFDGIGSGGAGSASHDIFVATSLVVKADNDNNPPTTVRAATRTATTDIASYLADKRYVTVEPKPVPHKGEQFVDTTSVLKFEVTAVGDTNTVMVITNNYTGTSYTVPDTVKYLDVDFAVTETGGNVFYNCSSLQSVTLPEGLLTIGSSAFENCSSLESITIPASVTTIEEFAFTGSGLQTITIPAGVTTIGEGAFYECSSLASVTFLGNACQNGIGEDAFAGVGADAPALLTLHGTWAKENQPDEDGNWYGGKFELAEDPTTLPQMRAAVKATKVLTNGQVIFRAENKNFSILGQEVR